LRADARHCGKITIGWAFFLPEASESSGGQFAKFNKESNDHWLKRESAVLKIESEMADGTIEIYVQNPQSGALIYLDPGDWRIAAFRDEIIRGGIVRASACESIEPYHGWPVLADEGSVRRSLAAGKSRRPAADEGKCQAWLLEAMLASPYQKIKAKPKWRIEATRLFGVTVRAFNRAWSSAIEASGSTWNLPGAPRKSAQ
jgi:hypothetical protein